MGIVSTMKKVSLLFVASLTIASIFPVVAFAHVVVKPGEVTTASYQTFSVNVPNEKDIPTVGVKVLIPENVASVTPTKKMGWKITTETEDDVVTAIVWSGGEIADGLRDEFTFSAKTPEVAGVIKWKAYQTYSDGTVVAWDQEESDEGHEHSGDEAAGPLSITDVVVSPEVEAGTDTVRIQATAERAQYVAVVAIVLALIAVFIATRKR